MLICLAWFSVMLIDTRKDFDSVLKIGWFRLQIKLSFSYLCGSALFGLPHADVFSLMSGHFQFTDPDCLGEFHNNPFRRYTSVPRSLLGWNLIGEETSGEYRTRGTEGEAILLKFQLYYLKIVQLWMRGLYSILPWRWWDYCR